VVGPGVESGPTVSLPPPPKVNQKSQGTSAATQLAHPLTCIQGRQRLLAHRFGAVDVRGYD
jgi:hypothetical protein